MVTSLISVQSKKKKRQTPKIYSTRKLKVLFRNSNHSEKFFLYQKFSCRKLFSENSLDENLASSPFSKKKIQKKDFFHNYFTF